MHVLGVFVQVRRHMMAIDKNPMRNDRNVAMTFVCSVVANDAIDSPN
jgi:hypothetical protein